MQKKTIDHVLRSTWQSVSKMYNEEAAKYNSSMAVGFALLSIDPKKGTPSTSLGPKMGMEATSLSRTLKSMEEKKLTKIRKNPGGPRVNLHKLTADSGISRDRLLKSKKITNVIPMPILLSKCQKK